MSWQELPDCPEVLECDMETAYPGLPSHVYQSIAYESQHRASGGSGGRDWAMTACKLAWLEMKRNSEPASENMDAEYFS